jgi:uncharacterized protein YceH (UPF0502 family)
MADRRRRGRRTNLLDLWQNVLDDTKDFVDDSVDRIRDDDYDGDVDLRDDIEELRKAVAALNTRLDGLVTAKER